LVEDEEDDGEFGHIESKEGDSVAGIYELIQPDGHERTVTYTADDHEGFLANVTYNQPRHGGYVYR